MKLIAEPTDAQVREELWTSFVSVLSAYVAAASLGLPGPATTVERTADDLRVQGKRRMLRLQFTPQSGEGQWELGGNGSEASGAFTLLPDGTFAWSGIEGHLQMDEIAERLATLVSE